MEFFREVPIKASEQWIQQTITFKNLALFSSEIILLDQQDLKLAQIGGLWGEFTLQRTAINRGVRFALLECPNALCWTLTTGYPPNREALVLHLTINRTQKDEAFIEEINEFLDDQVACIAQNFILTTGGLKEVYMPIP